VRVVPRGGLLATCAATATAATVTTTNACLYSLDD
jgi:hypothetical protein